MGMHGGMGRGGSELSLLLHGITVNATRGLKLQIMCERGKGGV